MAVLVGGLVPRDTEVADGTVPLREPRGVIALTVGSTTYVANSASADDGVTFWELGADGALTEFAAFRDLPALALDGASNFASATVGGATYLYVNAYNDSGVTAFLVEEGSVTAGIATVFDDGTLALEGGFGRMAVAQVGDASFLVAAGSAPGENGFSVLRILPDGTLSPTDTQRDVGLAELEGPFDVATATVEGRTFAFVAAYEDDGLSVYEIDASGGASLVGAADDASDPALELQGAWGVATAAVGGVSYVVVAGADDAGLSVFSVDGWGTLTNVFNLADDATLTLGAPLSVTPFVVEGETFLAVGAYLDSAIAVFHLGAGGVLRQVAAASDGGGAELSGAYDSTFAVVGGAALLVATAYGADAVTSLELGGDDDALRGGGAADTILGLGGDDDLMGGGGGDRLLGGWGDDSLSGNAGDDSLLGGEGRDRLGGDGGTDRLEGGAGDDAYVLRDALDLVVEAAGGGRDRVVAFVDVTLAAEVEDLRLAVAGLSGSGNGLGNRMWGSGGADTLAGAAGDDRLLGLGGGDRLAGGAGEDRLFGGAGADRLSGGAGRDFLDGGAGADVFVLDAAALGQPHDRVEGFEAGLDRLSLAALDADPGTAGDDAFVLDAGDGFLAGEVRQLVVAAGLLVQVNLDDDPAAEAAILLAGVAAPLAPSSFDL